MVMTASEKSNKVDLGYFNHWTMLDCAGSDNKIIDGATVSYNSDGNNLVYIFFKSLFFFFFGNYDYYNRLLLITLLLYLISFKQ